MLQSVLCIGTKLFGYVGIKAFGEMSNAIANYQIVMAYSFVFDLWHSGNKPSAIEELVHPQSHIFNERTLKIE